MASLPDSGSTAVTAAEAVPHPRPLRARTIEVLWHCNERNEEAELLGLQSSMTEGITSIDYNPRSDRFVTTGGDGNLRLWEIRTTAVDAWLENGANDMLACCRHICRMRTSWMPVTARWSPQGEMIASAHCDGKVCLWWRDTASEPASADADGDVEEWKAYRHLSGHTSDVYDLCFSADSRYLLSGAGDGSIVIHDLEGSTLPVLQLQDVHTKFCRGVAWDPWTRYVHTFGCGPSLLCFTHVPKSAGHHRRMHLAGQRKCQGDYMGESCALSFRRLGWSPDGLLLAVPYGKVGKAGTRAAQPSTAHLLASIEAKEKAEAGQLPSTSTAPAARPTTLVADESPADAESDDVEDMLHCVYVYSRGAPEKVACRLGVRGFNEVRGVRWAPCFLEPLPVGEVLHDVLQPPPPETAAASADVPVGSASAATATEAALEAARQRRGAWGPAEYRMALAVWTSDAVLVYTTDSSARHSDFTDLHMRSITDVAWSHNASHLYTASLDGYISVIAFGTSLAVAHRLPAFSSSPAVRTLCGLLERLERIGLSIEGGRSTGPGAKAGGTGGRGASPSAAGAVSTGSSSNAATTATANTNVAVVRKKKKIEKPAADAATKDVNMQQLEALVTDIG